MLEIFETYSTEIIAGVAILVLVAIYFKYIKPKVEERSSQKESIKEIIVEEADTELNNDLVSETPVDEVRATSNAQDIEKIQTIANVKILQDDYKGDSLSGEEEGSFGEYIQDETQSNNAPDSKVITTLNRTKRTVPSHGKITKENFKEFAGCRILVAEDNLINQKVISGLLADSGIELVIADDGQIVLDILEEDSNFNFILMDAHMPRLDGFEATRAIRQIQEYNHIIIIAFSGDTAADDIKKMEAAGMEEHLEKPLKIDSLYDILFTYSGSTNIDEDDAHHELKDSFVTKNIDTNKGLSISGHDEDFYNEILDEFTKSYSSSPAKLRELLKSAKMKEADKYLLDLSGITANIGAEHISIIVLDFKHAIKTPKDKRYVQVFKDYTNALQLLLKDIADYKS